MAGGCLFTLMRLFIVPFFAVAAAMFFGMVFGSIAAAAASTVLFIVLNKNGFFEKYRDSDEPLKKYGPTVVKVLLIIVMILSWLATAGLAYFIFSPSSAGAVSSAVV